jgi:hypothetical protein
VKVIHVILAGATRYDRACAAIDSADDAEISHEVFDATPAGWTRGGIPSSLDDVKQAAQPGSAALLHVHGTSQPPRRLLTGLSIPWISDRNVSLPRSLFRRIPPPAAILAERGVPDVAGDDWFAASRAHRHGHQGKTVGSYVRCAGTRNGAEQVFGRIRRFRDDVDWAFFEAPPSPAELAGLDLWVDPATRDDDLDGMVVEAIACLTPVAAARTAANGRRLDDGKAGLLTPVGDHNEMTHAVLNLLFKEEVAAPRRIHAGRIRDRFRALHRRDAVRTIYREVCG